MMKENILQRLMTNDEAVSLNFSFFTPESLFVMDAHFAHLLFVNRNSIPLNSELRNVVN